MRRPDASSVPDGKTRLGSGQAVETSSNANNEGRLRRRRSLSPCARLFPVGWPPSRLAVSDRPLRHAALAEVDDLTFLGRKSVGELFGLGPSMLPTLARAEGSTGGSSSAAKRARLARQTRMDEPNRHAYWGRNGRGWDRTSDSQLVPTKEPSPLPWRSTWLNSPQTHHKALRERALVNRKGLFKPWS
jgi:hypothetical protein